MVRLSRKFIEALKLGEKPAYKVAWEAGVHPVLLSKLIHGYEKISPNDSRVIAVGRALGLQSDQCFEKDSE